MLFSSPEFLFVFLPGFLGLYACLPPRARNGALFLASLFFYWTPSGILALVLILSVLLNYGFGFLVTPRGRLSETPRRVWLAIGIALNLLPLLYYKYAQFVLVALRDAMGAVGFHPALPSLHLLLPVGISFFTFQAISYLSDIYLGRVVPARSLIDFGMYHSCFPQLIAGPIVRYEEVEGRIRRRDIDLDDVYNGVVQFCFGFGKKVILADPAGQVADRVFALHGLNAAFAWTGIIAYSLQVYFDFSGYSDMAIGIGRMLGFYYPANFDQPYRSRSVTEFWRRWHMTLSRWFKDYVYIPLGGNRLGLPRTMLHLVAVFFLCGLWHGAQYTFVVWGLYHGALLIAERLGRRWLPVRVPEPIGWAYTTLAVIVGWVLFRAGSLTAASNYLGAMFGVHEQTPYVSLTSILTGDHLTCLLLGILFALLPFESIVAFSNGRYSFGSLLSIFSLGTAVLATIMLSSNGFSPFIYFRF